MVDVWTKRDATPDPIISLNRRGMALDYLRWLALSGVCGGQSSSRYSYSYPPFYVPMAVTVSCSTQIDYSEIKAELSEAGLPRPLVTSYLHGVPVLRGCPYAKKVPEGVQA